MTAKATPEQSSLPLSFKKENNASLCLLRNFNSISCHPAGVFCIRENPEHDSAPT
jgi:hypothetical protein